MLSLKVIKSEQEYEIALAQIERLMTLDPMPNTSDADLLEVLSVLIAKYEDEIVELEPPSPIEAIKFRMDQQDLKNKDLIPYIGSGGKVSEILNGKRTLSLEMIRALHRGLGIPYSSLMKDPQDIETGESVEWSKFPLKEMLKRNLITQDKKRGDIKDCAEEYVKEYFGGSLDQELALLLRTSASTRSGREMKKESLSVWHNEVTRLAGKQNLTSNFDLDKLDNDFFEELAKLSTFVKGPLLAKEYLSRYGIHLVVVEHFQKTYLDGAAIRLEDDSPVVALTLRHDRLDNFWFVLLHELAHIKKHLYTEDQKVIFDDLDVDIQGQSPIEKEADDFAIKKLIPAEVRDQLKELKTAADVSLTAMRYDRNPAIFAGYIRKEKSNYRLFNGLVGRNQVRKLFELEGEL